MTVLEVWVSESHHQRVAVVTIVYAACQVGRRGVDRHIQSIALIVFVFVGGVFYAQLGVQEGVCL